MPSHGQRLPDAGLLCIYVRIYMHMPYEQAQAVHHMNDRHIFRCNENWDIPGWHLYE